MSKVELSSTHRDNDKHFTGETRETDPPVLIP